MNGKSDNNETFEIEPVFELVWNSVFAFCPKTFSQMNRPLLEDVCSEAIYGALKSYRGDYYGRDNLRAFISLSMTVARYTGYAHIRKQKRRQVVDSEILADQLAAPSE